MKVVLESNKIGQKWVPIRVLNRPVMIGDIVIFKSVADTLDDNAYYIGPSGFKSRCHICSNDNKVTRYRDLYTNEYEVWAIGQCGESIIDNCVPIEIIGVNYW